MLHTSQKNKKSKASYTNEKTNKYFENRDISQISQIQELLDQGYIIKQMCSESVSISTASSSYSTKSRSGGFLIYFVYDETWKMKEFLKDTDDK